MKIAEAKAAVDKDLETSKNVAAWDIKVRSKSDHLKNAEIAKTLLETQGIELCSGDNVKDEEGYRAVFTEPGASASQMAAAKSRSFFVWLERQVTQFQRTLR